MLQKLFKLYIQRFEYYTSSVDYEVTITCTPPADGATFTYATVGAYTEVPDDPVTNPSLGNVLYYIGFQNMKTNYI